MSTATLVTTGFRVEPKPFAAATAWVAKHLASKPTDPILAGLLLEYGDGLLRVSGFDYDTSASAQLDIPAGGHGRVVVSGRLLAEVVKTLPDKPVDVQLDGSHVRVTCGSVRLSLPTLHAEDYPALPLVPAVIGFIEARAFATAAERVLVAADHDGSAGIPELKGVHLAFTAETMQAIATDRYRVAVDFADWKAADPAFDRRDILVHADVLANVARTYGDAGSIDIATDGGVVAFVAAGRTVVTRLLAVEKSPTGKVPGLLPKISDQPARIDVADLAAAVKRAQLVRGTKPLPVRITFADGEAAINLTGEGDTSIGDAVPCEYAGSEITVGMNPGLLLDALAALRGDVAEFHISTAIKPVLLTNPNDADYRHVIVPIRSMS